MGWIIKPLNELCVLNPKHDKNLADNLDISFVPMAAVDEKTGTISPDVECRKLGEIRKGYTHFANEDVIFAKITPCMENGKSAIAKNLCNGLACGSTEFYTLRSYGAISPEYLHPFLRQNSYIQNASMNMTGVVGHRRVTKDFILSTSLPLPPLNEQKRIVNKIEALQTRSAAVKEELKAIKPLLNQFRQSVLAAAFRGDLTKEWRSQNPNVESAEVLLERIKKELLQTERKKDNKPLPNPFEIDNKWQWVKLSDVCNSITDGDHQAPPKSNYGIPFLVISNISKGKLNFDDTRYVPENYYNKLQENKKPRNGDIVYSVVGSYGIPVLVDTDKEFCFQRHIALLKSSNWLNNSYLLYALKSNFVYRQATSVATGTTQLTVTLTGLRKIKIPLTSLEEQKEIVRRIESLFKLADNIEQQYQQAEIDLQTLNQSILAKAFRGELVPQDPNDEPASVLLERIRAEREQAKPKKSESKKKRSSKKQDKQLGIPGI